MRISVDFVRVLSAGHRGWTLSPKKGTVKKWVWEPLPYGAFVRFPEKEPGPTRARVWPRCKSQFCDETGAARPETRRSLVVVRPPPRPTISRRNWFRLRKQIRNGRGFARVHTHNPPSPQSTPPFRPVFLIPLSKLNYAAAAAGHSAERCFSKNNECTASNGLDTRCTTTVLTVLHSLRPRPSLITHPRPPPTQSIRFDLVVFPRNKVTPLFIRSLIRTKNAKYV